jgi:hypothetical protein
MISREIRERLKQARPIQAQFRVQSPVPLQLNESVLTTAQSDDQPDDKAHNETKRASAKKISIPRPPSKLETW